MPLSLCLSLSLSLSLSLTHTHTHSEKEREINKFKENIHIKFASSDISTFGVFTVHV